MNDAVKRVAKSLAGRLGCMPDDAGCVEHPERAWDTGYGLCWVAVLLAEDAITTMQEPSIGQETMIDSIAGGTITVPGGYGELQRDDAENIVDALMPILAAPLEINEAKLAEVRAEAVREAARYVERITPKGLVNRAAILADLEIAADRLASGTHANGREYLRGER